MPDLAAGGHVPQPDTAFEADAGQGLAVRAERHRANRAGVEGRGDRAGGRKGTRDGQGVGQSRDLRRELLRASVVAWGLNSTKQAAPVWRALPIGRPVATSHNRTVAVPGGVL